MPSASSLFTHTLPRENNLDVLRLILAWIVVFVHMSDLSGAPLLHSMTGLLSSRFAVDGFFAISGCLIVASWDRSPNLRTYYKRRAQRILPGYWGALVFTLVLGTILTSWPLKAFFESRLFLKYVVSNILFMNFLQPDLPGVFIGQRFTAMNGALWTIKVEVGFYIFAPVLVWFCRKVGTWQTLISCFVLSSLYRMLLQGQYATLAQQLPGQLCYFATGAAYYFYFPWLQTHKRQAWTAAIVLTAVAVATNFLPLRAIGIPLLVLCAGFFLPVRNGVLRWGDLSYGTYVLHFPVVQTLVAVGFFAKSPGEAVAVGVFCIVPLAAFSWHFVERPFLRRARVRRVEVAIA